MERSTAMPAEPFVSLFKEWPGNWFLTFEESHL